MVFQNTKFGQAANNALHSAAAVAHLCHSFTAAVITRKLPSATACKFIQIK